MKKTLQIYLMHYTSDSRWYVGLTNDTQLNLDEDHFYLDICDSHEEAVSVLNDHLGRHFIEYSIGPYTNERCVYIFKRAD